jgi:hypothetical protein
VSGKRIAKYKKIAVDLPKGKLSIYAGQKVRSALVEVVEDMTLYKGVRLSQVIQAVYEQGKKDGRKEVVDKFESLRKGLNYLPPGRPRKRTLHKTGA